MGGARQSAGQEFPDVPTLGEGDTGAWLVVRSGAVVLLEHHQARLCRSLSYLSHPVELQQPGLLPANTMKNED